MFSGPISSSPKPGSIFPTKSSGGFTWYEILILLAVLAVLWVLLIPRVGEGLSASPRAQAKNDVVQIATAISAFKTEYDRLPSTKAGALEVSGPILQALMGSNRDLNPRQIVFLEVQPAKRSWNGTWKRGLHSGTFVDPWGSPYMMTFDTDGDGKITNAGPSGRPAKTLSKAIAVWNDPGTHSDWASQAKKQKRYVTSWE